MRNLWSRIKSALPIMTRAQAYEGATHGRRSAGWHAPSTGPNKALNHALNTLRNRSLQAYRNNPWIRQAIDRNVSNEVGTGIVPMFDSSNDDYNRRDWRTHRWPHIHPTQDVRATIEEIENDLESLDAAVAKRGYRAADIQHANVNARKRKADLERQNGLEPGDQQQ